MPKKPQRVLPASPLKQVADAELARYAKLVYQRTGIRIPAQKKMLLSNRVRRRLRETGIQDFSAYYNHLKQLRPGDPEWDAFLQEITTHETYLFRDAGQWDWFSKTYLPQLATEARAGKRPRQLRIWSAACSTGDEAFTIACCIAAHLPNYKSWKVQIVGTDIGVGAVQEAKKAIFRERAMRHVSDSYKKRFFDKAPRAEVWKARSMLTNMTAFHKHNLMNPLKTSPFDLVFLKNVLIYFDRNSKRRVMENVRAAIRPKGLLVAGAAEGIGELVKDFVRIQPWLHQRP